MSISLKNSNETFLDTIEEVTDDDLNGIIITATRTADRLDKFLKEECPDRSRTELQELIKSGDITQNGLKTKNSTEVLIGDEIFVPNPVIKDCDVKPESMDLDIVYEDHDLIIVNKPSGMVVHPANGNWSGTLVNGLMAHATLADGSASFRPGIVHRIDKDTSGLLVVAKTDAAMKGLSEQFKVHSITREYTALVAGQIPAASGKIDAPIGRNPANRQVFAVVEEGKPCITHFKVMERFGYATLINCRLETGRTHQIRVHAQYIGHPVVNDPLYNATNYNFIDKEFGQMLHAGKLGFIHPITHEYMEFNAPVPDYFAEIVDIFRRQSK